jgi:DNA gyrase subunit B
MSTIDRLDRVYPKHIMEELIYRPTVTVENLKDQAFMNDWIDTFKSKLESEKRSGTLYEISMHQDSERGLFLPQVAVTEHGIVSNYVISHEFFESPEYQSIVDLGNHIATLLEEGAYVQRGERQYEVASFKQALEWLMKEARKGFNIQRYKGLGEMNPDQLWETTMDPDSRRMLQVKVEDAIAADQMFTTLMGDDVEPRRAFIEQNALNVSNLDF